MARPLILVDDAVAHAEAAFGELGELHPVRAADIPEALARLQPEALIVRSVTTVDAGLLARAPSLGFVATATAGTDHLDHVSLAARGITVASAAGCNAQAVAQWVLAALTVCAAAGPVGIVGFGQVGSRLAALLRGLGREVLACDPPLARAGASAEPLVEFEALWRRCPIVSFHVPLIRSGPDRTLAYLDAHTPAAGGGPKLIINSSRGAVVRDAALDRADVRGAILDVWDGEPKLRAARLRDSKLLLASPHVAGYSLEAKLAGTRMVHEALCAWLGRPPSWTGAAFAPPRMLDPAPETLAGVLAAVVDLAGDDARTRALALLPEPARSREFEALRRSYALRREFSAWSVPAAHPHAGWLRAAGFQILGGS